MRIAVAIVNAMRSAINVLNYFAHLESTRFGAYEPYDFSRDLKPL